MKIYVVVSGVYSDYGIDDVFIDKEKAMAYCAARNDREYRTNFDSNYRIEEYDTSNNDIQSSVETGYVYSYLYYANIKEYEILQCAIRSKQFYDERCVDNWYRRNIDGNECLLYEVFCFLKEENEELALKICRDKLAMLKAKTEGVSL